VEHSWFCHSGSKGALKAVLQKWLICHFGHANQANGPKRKAFLKKYGFKTVALKEKEKPTLSRCVYYG
tara:strand:+ start:4451 stop:4654 length:204 start_codon:yes stop_codon:yes gene_type:complete